MNNSTPRDLLFSLIHDKVKSGEDIYVVSADFGCEALDAFSKEFPHRYVNVGIAEQNAVLVATGLALEGKNVFVYGIASFISMRCYEQLRVDLDGMCLPVTIVGVGANDDYKEAGFTHWAYEDVPIIEQLENFIIFDRPKQYEFETMIKERMISSQPAYIRLNRKW